LVAQLHAPDLANHVHGDHLISLLKVSAGQWNTLVNFGSALCGLAGQFCFGTNTVVVFVDTCAADLIGHLVHVSQDRPIAKSADLRSVFKTRLSTAKRCYAKRNYKNFPHPSLLQYFSEHSIDGHSIERPVVAIANLWLAPNYIQPAPRTRFSLCDQYRVALTGSLRRDSTNLANLLSSQIPLALILSRGHFVANPVVTEDYIGDVSLG
jgi:hypothetical protein